jgi:hypothetical protein
MSNKVIELIERNRQLELEINDIKRELIQKTYESALKDQRIQSLESLLDDLEREKWSIQSELENLRGY